MTMSPSSVCTRTRTLSCSSAVTAKAVAVATATATSKERHTIRVIGGSEAIRGGKLELSPREHVAAARVLSEAWVANQVDVPISDQILVVEHVEQISAHL